MKRMAFLLGLIVCPLAFCLAQVGGKDFIDQNYIEVTGTAAIEVVPDEIYLKIVIGDKDQKGKLGIEQLEKKMFDRLKKLGIDVKKDLSVRDAASSLKSYKLKGSEIKMTKEYVLLVRTTQLLNEVFLGLDEIGISDASVEKVGHSNITRYRRDVKVDAIKVAKEKAESLAEAIGQTIGRALYINEAAWGGRPFQLSNTVFNAEGGKMETAIEFEKIKLEATILVRFELK